MSKLKKNILYKFFSFTERFFTQLLFPSLMIMYWGKDNYSYWLFFLSIPMFFSMIQFTTTDAIRNKMSLIEKENNISKLNILYQNSIFINFINILILSLIILIYLNFNLKNENLSNNYEIIFLVLINSFIPFLSAPLILLLTYKGSMKIYLSLNIIFNILITILIPTSYFFVNDFEKVFYLFLILNFLRLLITYNFVNDNRINKTINFKLFRIKEVVNIIKFSAGYNFEIIANFIKGPGLIFVIGSSPSILSLALIQTARTLFYYLPFQVFNILSGPLIYEINNRFKKGFFDFEEKRKFLGLVLSILFIFLIGYYIIELIGVSLYNLWLNNKIEISGKLIELIFLDAAIIIFLSFIILPLKSLNKHFGIAILDLFFNAITLIFIFIFELFNNIISMFEVILIFSIVNSIFKLFISYLIYKKNKL